MTATDPNVPSSSPAGEALVQQIAEAIRPILREHAAVLPDVRPWCMCGHKAQTPFARETHLRDVLARAVLPWVEAQVAPLRALADSLANDFSRATWEVAAAESALRQVREDLARVAQALIDQSSQLRDVGARSALLAASRQVDAILDSARVGAADTQPEGAGEVERLWFVDKATREPCPTMGNRLCIITDRDHLHVDGRTPTAGSNGDTAPEAEWNGPCTCGAWESSHCDCRPADTAPEAPKWEYPIPSSVSMSTLPNRPASPPTEGTGEAGCHHYADFSGECHCNPAPVVTPSAEGSE